MPQRLVELRERPGLFQVGEEPQDGVPFGLAVHAFFGDGGLLFLCGLVPGDQAVVALPKGVLVLGCPGVFIDGLRRQRREPIAFLRERGLLPVEVGGIGQLVEKEFVVLGKLRTVGINLVKRLRCEDILWPPGKATARRCAAAPKTKSASSMKNCASRVAAGFPAQ